MDPKVPWSNAEHMTKAMVQGHYCPPSYSHYKFKHCPGYNKPVLWDEVRYEGFVPQACARSALRTLGPTMVRALLAPMRLQRCRRQGAS